MIKAFLVFTRLFNEAPFLDYELDFTVDTVEHTLTSCMLGCTENVDDVGVLPLSICINNFEDAMADEFPQMYMEIFPQFAELYNRVK